MKSKGFTDRMRKLLFVLGAIGMTSCIVLAQGSSSEDLLERYHAIKTEVERLREQGKALPMPELREYQRRLNKARQNRDWEEAKQILNQIEEFLSPWRTEETPFMDASAKSEPPYLPSLQANKRCGAKAEGMDSFFGVAYTVHGLAEIYAKTGCRWSKIPLVSWGRLEPTPPKGGKHHYQWTPLDKVVQEYQRYGFHLQMVLKASNSWANETDKAKGGLHGPGKRAVSMLPKAKYRQDYCDFVASVVERYDGDGHLDMPGLRFPVLYYEIESEAQHEGYWRGSHFDYGTLLKLAHDAAKSSCSEAQIILSGINFGDLFADDPSQEQLRKRLKQLPPFHRKAFRFISYSLSLVDYYDVIEFHYNRDYRSVFKTMDWLRKELKKHGREKPIWAGDAISTVWLFAKYSLQQLPYPDEQIYHGLIHPKQRSLPIEKWFRSAQAEVSVKKHVVGAGAGLAGMMLETTRDWPPSKHDQSNYYKNWRVSGLINSDKSPRPVYYAYKQMIHLLVGFEKAVRLPSADKDYLYYFSFSNKPAVYVIWTESKAKQVSISPSFTQATVESVITQVKEKAKSKRVSFSGGTLKIMASTVPVYVYEATEDNPGR